MIEVEVKGRANSEVKEKIESKYPLIEEKVEVDVYFSHPCRDLAKTDEALRVRRERKLTGERQSLAYKGPKVDPLSKTRLEVELEVNSASKTENLLKLLGFKPIATVKKRRRVYRVDRRTLIFYDEVEGLGEFVEAEVRVASPEEIPATRDDLISLLKSLGVKNFTRLSYLELLQK